MSRANPYMAKPSLKTALLQAPRHLIQNYRSFRTLPLAWNRRKSLHLSIQFVLMGIRLAGKK